MTPPSKDSPKNPSTVALFRFAVVSQVRSRVLAGEAQADAIAQLAAQQHAHCDSRAQSVSERSIYRWLAAFAAQGLAGLEPASRQRTSTSVVLAASVLDFIVAQKEEDVRASLPEIVRRARQRGVIGETERIHRSTVYRACVRMGVPVVRRTKARVRDSRRFAYPHRMDLILSDGKHFRAGATRKKRLAMFFLDDATRFGLHAVVGPSESKALFLRGLYETVQHHGISGIVYLDHGSGFIAKDTLAVVAQLPALLIHGEVAYPEGHGKIERFHQTAEQALLRGLDGRAEVDPDCGALELRLRHWLREIYNHTPHESLDLKTPWQRFSADPRPLRFPESLATLRERFVVALQRKVSNDHVVSFDGVDFETPRGLAGTWVTLYHQVLDGTISVLHPDRSGRIVRLHPVDVVANAKARRGEPPTSQKEPAVYVLPKSAADLAFDQDFRPVIDSDGGFTGSTKKDDTP